ncbi:hypothetical protein V6760_11100 [Acinetobacter venetianus]
MLASNVLKLRLDRIEQQGHHLSVKDQLKLVTLAQPELTASFYTQFFHQILPKHWSFQHHTAEDIQCSLRLILLIDQVFIRHYSKHAYRYEWFEQGLLFRLQYAKQALSASERAEIIAHLDQCKDSALKLSILKQLKDEYDDIQLTLALAELSYRLADWPTAIENYHELLQQQPAQPEQVYYNFIHCLLSRNHYVNEQGHSDVVEALEHLGNLDQIQQQARYQQLTHWAVSLILPETLQAEAINGENPFSDIQQKLKEIGYSLNHWLSADEFRIPYYKNIVETAPKLLNNQEIVMHLDRHKVANHALQTIFSDRDLKLVSGVNASSHSLGFIWNYLQINPLVLDALVTASNGEPEAFYNLKQIPAPNFDHQAALLQLSSYLAKQQVAYNLTQQGHSIEFVEHAHLAGFDLIVDGTPMQVKCSLERESIEDFAKSHPHIAIIVNIELADLQEHYPSVFADLALSYESVQRTAQNSLQGSGHVDDYLPVPLMNTGFAVYRNFNKTRHQLSIRPDWQYKPNQSLVKNSLAIGAAIGGIVSGSIGAFVVGSFAVYRTWRIQKIEQRKPLQEKQQLLMQRDHLMYLLIDFAEWFNHNLLKYRVDLYAYQLRQVEMKLMGKIPELVLSTTLFAYKFEAHQRAEKLYQWIEKQLAHDNPKYKIQAGWVALAQSSQFISIELKQRVQELNLELEKYKKMTQYGLTLSSLEQSDAHRRSHQQMTAMDRRFKVPSQS